MRTDDLNIIVGVSTQLEVAQSNRHLQQLNGAIDALASQQLAASREAEARAQASADLRERLFQLRKNIERMQSDIAADPLDVYLALRVTLPQIRSLSTAQFDRIEDKEYCHNTAMLADRVAQEAREVLGDERCTLIDRSIALQNLLAATRLAWATVRGFLKLKEQDRFFLLSYTRKFRQMLNEGKTVEAVLRFFVITPTIVGVPLAFFGGIRFLDDVTFTSTTVLIIVLIGVHGGIYFASRRIGAVVWDQVRDSVVSSGLEHPEAIVSRLKFLSKKELAEFQVNYIDSIRHHAPHAGINCPPLTTTLTAGMDGLLATIAADTIRALEGLRAEK